MNLSTVYRGSLDTVARERDADDRQRAGRSDGGLSPSAESCLVEGGRQVNALRRSVLPNGAWQRVSLPGYVA